MYAISILLHLFYEWVNNMKIGEFEEIVLLLVAYEEGDSYGLSIAQAIETDLNRSVTLSSVHTALYRLEEKGLVVSSIGGTTKKRGGRRKRLFEITNAGKRILVQARESRRILYNKIPNHVLKDVKI